MDFPFCDEGKVESFAEMPFIISYQEFHNNFILNSDNNLSYLIYIIHDLVASSRAGFKGRESKVSAYSHVFKCGSGVCRTAVDQSSFLRMIQNANLSLFCASGFGHDFQW